MKKALRGWGVLWFLKAWQGLSHRKILWQEPLRLLYTHIAICPQTIFCPSHTLWCLKNPLPPQDTGMAWKPEGLDSFGFWRVYMINWTFVCCYLLTCWKVFCWSMLFSWGGAQVLHEAFWRVWAGLVKVVVVEWYNCTFTGWELLWCLTYIMACDRAWACLICRIIFLAFPQSQSLYLLAILYAGFGPSLSYQTLHKDTIPPLKLITISSTDFPIRLKPTACDPIRKEKYLTLNIKMSACTQWASTISTVSYETYLPAMPPLHFCSLYFQAFINFWKDSFKVSFGFGMRVLCNCRCLFNLQVGNSKLLTAFLLDLHGKGLLACVWFFSTLYKLFLYFNDE